jgi:tetratricopeptide (TPR) repeat protein
MELKTGHAGDRHEVADAIQQFFLPAVDAAPTEESRGAIFYSLGNVRSNNHQYAQAVEAYNAARKSRPQYLSTDYFLNELGGALFEGRRYRCAAEAYRLALAISTTTQTTFCLGDALLYSGEFEAASSAFSVVASSSNASLAANARLKYVLASWFNEGVTRPKPEDADGLSQYGQDVQSATEQFLAVLAAAFAAKYGSDPPAS